ncbi:MAG: HD domain-containing protein, partial [Pseudomonadota bacterium]
MANAPTLTSHEPRSPATPQPPSEDAGTPRPGAAQTLVSEGQKARSPADHTPRYPAADLPPPPVGKSPKIVRQYELVDLVRAYDPDLDEDLLNRAYVFSMRAHGGQTRQSGDPYFTHPLSVAAILADLKLDPVTIVAALLHDVVEDTGVSVAEIRDLFGDDVALLVDGVTKISEREMSPDADGAAENFAKFILATSKDVRTLMVKLADRLHNMRTLHFIKNPDKQHRIALETMEIYAPLARIIGIDRFREELENLSFYYLLPEEYAGITAALERVAETAVSDVVALSQRLKKAISEAGIEAEIFSREKSAYSVYRKM